MDALLWLQENWVQNLVIAGSLGLFCIIMQVVLILTRKFAFALLSMPSGFVASIFFLLFLIGVIVDVIDKTQANS